MSIDSSKSAPVTRYVSKGYLRFDVFVTHRDQGTVQYTMGNDDTVYEKSPEAFDTCYGVPGKR